MIKHALAIVMSYGAGYPSVLLSQSDSLAKNFKFLTVLTTSEANLMNRNFEL